MIDETIEAFDTSPRRNFSSSRIAHLFFTCICLGHSGYLLNFCSPLQWSLWLYILFFACLIWMVFLFITSVIQFRNHRTRSFVNSLDWVFFIFHLAMFIWANINIFQSTSPVEAENFWHIIYLAIGYLAVLCLLCAVLMITIRSMNRKKLERENPRMLDLDQKQPYVKQKNKN